VWSPDSHKLVFSSSRDGHLDLYRKPIGEGEEELVYQSADSKGPYYWSKDGWLLFNGARGNIYRVPLTGERTPAVALKSDFFTDLLAVSQNERWVAYESNESGRWEVYAASYPSFSGKRQVSVAGGCQPLWRRDGAELFYLTLDGKLAVVEVKGGATLNTSTPHILAQTPMTVNPNQTEYAVTGDGKRFIFREPVGETLPPINVVVNWAVGLKR
jgi:hypothetical protein